MLQWIDLGKDDVVAFRWGGKLSKDEMKQIFDRLREKIEKHDKIDVYQEIVSIGGVELEGIVEKLKFLRDLGLSHFGKMAIITDKTWLKKVVAIEDKIFSPLNIKAFALKDKAEAVAFIIES